MTKSKRINEAPEGGVTYEYGNPSYTPSGNSVTAEPTEGIQERLGRLRREGKIPLALSYGFTEDGRQIAREVI